MSVYQLHERMAVSTTEEKGEYGKQTVLGAVLNRVVRKGLAALIFEHRPKISTEQATGVSRGRVFQKEGTEERAIVKFEMILRHPSKNIKNI